jgi:hypothetical protein
LGGAFEVESWGELEKYACTPFTVPGHRAVYIPGTCYLRVAFPNRLCCVFLLPKPDGPRYLEIYRLTDCASRISTLFWILVRRGEFATADFLYLSDEEREEGQSKGAGQGGKDVVAILHIDLGPSPTDHCTLFLSNNAFAHMQHCSFEVSDFDVQNLGYEWLCAKECTTVWGNMCWVP